jgi:Mn-dependent DtxR family transcriptional regulator
MALQESGEMYLESILVLSRQKEFVRSVDISEYMGYSKPSVSRAVGLLKAGQYITINGDGHIELTDAGRDIAEKILVRHRVLAEMLISLGVDRQVASADACKMEHVISDESFNAIVKHMQSHTK